MPEGVENLQRRVEEQIARIVQDFYGDSLRRLKSQLLDDRAQIEELAEQLPGGDARALIQNLIAYYSWVEGALDRAAQRAQEGAGGRAGQGARGAQGAAGGAVGRAAGVVGQVTGYAGQIVEGAQKAVGQALGQAVGSIVSIAENLPGGRLLSRTTDENGQTVQRAVTESGEILEITLDQAGDLAHQNPVGSLADLPAEEEHRNEEGQRIRTVKDEESGVLIGLRLGENGSILDLQIPPGAEEVG